MSVIALAAALTLQVQVFTPAAPPQQARQTQAQTEPGAAPADPDLVQQVCRNVPVTGSRFPRRVCRSARQDQADRDESRDMLRNWQGLPELPAGSASPKGFGGAPGPL